jgi:heme/copper-type cytochrome/quinol oxidase subunit 2
VALPPWPGAGHHPLSLANPAFYLLVAIIVVFAGMYAFMCVRYPRRKRGLEGFREAATISLGFLAFSVVLVVVLAMKDPAGNLSAYALDQVVLQGYWLTFSVPVVTVGSSVHTRTRGGIPWLVPSLLLAVAMFAVLFAFYFYVAPPG